MIYKLSRYTQYAMFQKWYKKWGTECLNTKFSLPSLLYAGCRIKKKKCGTKNQNRKLCTVTLKK